MSRDLNPIINFLDCYKKIDDHLGDRIDILMEKMNRTGSQSNDIHELENAVKNCMDQIANKPKDVDELAQNFEVIATADKNGLTSLDLEGSKWQPYVDKLYDAGKLSTRKYQFENKKEIDLFFTELDQQKSLLKNETSGPMLLIQPLLNLRELFANVTKKGVDSNENLQEKINRAMGGG